MQCMYEYCSNEGLALESLVGWSLEGPPNCRVEAKCLSGVVLVAWDTVSPCTRMFVGVVRSVLTSYARIVSAEA